MTVSHPRSGVSLEPKPIIVVNEPFGRTRAEINVNVDFAAHISLPLDLALVRLLRRMLKMPPKRRRNAAARSADMILDGTQTPEALKSELMEALRPLIAAR